jgi:hypothetical protein
MVDVDVRRGITAFEGGLLFQDVEPTLVRTEEIFEFLALFIVHHNPLLCAGEYRPGEERGLVLRVYTCRQELTECRNVYSDYILKMRVYTDFCAVTSGSGRERVRRLCKSQQISITRSRTPSFQIRIVSLTI